MTQIWHLSDQVVEKLFFMAQELKWDERRKQLEKAIDYIRSYNKKKFSWKKIRHLEERIILDKKERIMPVFKTCLEMEREEGLEEGIQEGIQRGIQKGIQKGTQEAHHNMAMRMLKANLSHKFIQEITGLSKEELKALSKKRER